MDLLKYLWNDIGFIFMNVNRKENFYVKIHLLPKMHHLPEGEKVA